MKRSTGVCVALLTAASGIFGCTTRQPGQGDTGWLTLVDGAKGLETFNPGRYRQLERCGRRHTSGQGGQNCCLSGLERVVPRVHVDRVPHIAGRRRCSHRRLPRTRLLVDARKLDYYHSLEAEHGGWVLVQGALEGLEALATGQVLDEPELDRALSTMPRA